jgi:hypothetical protein
MVLMLANKSCTCLADGENGNEDPHLLGWLLSRKNDSGDMSRCVK